MVSFPKIHLGEMWEYQRDPLDFAARCAREGGVVPVQLFFYPCIFVSSPSAIEEVLITHNHDCIKPFFLQWSFMRRLIGKGLLTSEGDHWRRQRRLAQPAFHRERIERYGAVMSEFASRTAASWNPGQTFDLHEAMMQLTMEIAAKTLFNADLGRVSKDVGELISVILKPFEVQATLRWFFHNYLPTAENRRFHRATKRLDEILVSLIDEHRASSLPGDDLLSLLLEARDEDGSQMTTKQLRDEVITLFIAGHETTALALTWTFYLLAQNPESEKALAAELKQALGGRPPTTADLPLLPYTEKILKEAIRLYPPVFAFGREVVRSFKIGSHLIPARSQILIFPYVVQRDPRYFPDPNRFIPERWTDDFVKGLRRFAYLPFGGGPRVCIGNTFAMTEAMIILATIAQQYQLSLMEERAVQPVPTVSLRPEGGIKIKVEPR